MGLKSFFREIICNHDYTATVGVGLYGEKKNKPVLKFYPVTKFICKKCKAEHFYIDPKPPKNNTLH